MFREKSFIIFYVDRKDVCLGPNKAAALYMYTRHKFLTFHVCTMEAMTDQKTTNESEVQDGRQTTA